MKLRDRRKRVRRPLLLVLFGIGYILMPVVNYIGAAFALDVPLHFYQVIARSFDPFQYAIMATAVVAGVGLLQIKKWGWWSALGLAGVITVYNLVILIQSRALYNLSALLLTVFAIAILLYFTRKDISAPYMKMYPRGWRYQTRTPNQIEIQINDDSFQTIDMSEYGLYAKMDADRFEPGQEIKVQLPLRTETFELNAVVVRVDENGAGLAFRDLNAERRSTLQKAIQAIG